MWSNVQKPTGDSFVRVKNGFPLYDDTVVAYDDQSYYFDGENPDAWGEIGKPTFGLLWNQATFTWDSANRQWVDNSYTRISKPT